MKSFFETGTFNFDAKGVENDKTKIQEKEEEEVKPPFWKQFMSILSGRF